MRDFSELNINEGGGRIERNAPSSEVICAFQDQFGITLPDEYLKLLRHSTGRRRHAGPWTNFIFSTTTKPHAGACGPP